MVLSLLLLAAPALADQAALEAPCALFVDGTQPMGDATGVPIDIAPAFVLSGCTGSSDTLLVTLTDNTGAQAFNDVLELEGTTFDARHTVELPVLALLPDTTYDVQIEGALVQGGWSFTTGTGLAEEGDAPPIIVLEEALGWVQGTGFQVNLSGSITGGSDQPVRLTSTQLDTTQTLTPGRQDFYFQALASEAEICLTPEIRDDRGTWTSGNTSCLTMSEIEPPQSGRGCSSMGLSGLLLGPLPLLMMRRRRQNA